ncbi:MAG: prepilin-type N-terminal cleavage/methylation domain-containing protein [Nocardioides sp.]|nr:prepilin-type N-terminal cleavage/methylation domain-containing protein [Nocardioides sp.]
MRSLSLDIRNRRRSDDGFTLIELLVVVVILGILIGIAIPVYLNYRRSANDKAAQSDVRNAVSTLEVCNSDGGYPTAVPSSGGAVTGCTQTVTISGGTELRYVPSSVAAPVASYVIYGTNTGGSANRIFCYNSTAGGSVKTVTSPATPTLATATC